MKPPVILLLSLFLLSGCTGDAQTPEGDLVLTFFDVGQGDSVLIEGPSGQNVLYDGGRKDEEVLEYLQAAGVAKLDLVIASHPDADHIGGLEAVVRHYRPQLFMDNGLRHDTATYQGLLDAVGDVGAQGVPATTRRLNIGEMSLQVVEPPGDEGLGTNDNSVGVIISYGDFDAGLTGDAEKPQFDWWLTHIPDVLREVEVYKASHHGSPNGDTLEGVTTFDPETVVISVGLDNSYNHPSEEALALYEGVGADIYRTDLHGTVVITASPDGSYRVDAQANSSEATRPVLPEDEPDDTTSLPYDPAGPDRDCGDFAVQEEAQAFLEAAGGPQEDPHRLDSDDNGVACEST